MHTSPPSRRQLSTQMLRTLTWSPAVRPPDTDDKARPDAPAAVLLVRSASTGDSRDEASGYQESVVGVWGAGDDAIIHANLLRDEIERMRRWWPTTTVLCVTVRTLVHPDDEPF